MNWNDLKNGHFDLLKRDERVQRAYDEYLASNERAELLPSGLIANEYPYETEEGIYNYVLFCDSISDENTVEGLFPSGVQVISYVNHISRRSIPHKYHVNIFINTKMYRYDGKTKIIDLLPDLRGINGVLQHGCCQFPPYHPVIYKYYTYVLDGGRNRLSEYTCTIPEWFQDFPEVRDVMES